MQKGTPSVVASVVICGIGYTGAAVAAAAHAAGFAVAGTARDPAVRSPPPGVKLVGFENAGPAIAAATHLLVTAGPGEAGDPVLERYRNDVSHAPELRWIGYFSTTGVLGDRGGAWVDEDTQPAPASERTRRRVQAEVEWRGFSVERAVDVFRVAGIYGPGRSVFDDLRAGTARRIVKPGHAFGRIHRDDIARAVLVALAQDRGPGLRILNLADDEPAESAVVVEEAAKLLGVDPPDAVPFAQAWKHMGPMARSFWGESRRVASARTKAMLGIEWLYPTYREGLRAILREERLQGTA
jgi:nucleoside-diphosphate-sugar epimerase